MKTLFFVLCLFLSVEGALSQETGKLYTTFSDLLNETSSSTLNVIKEKRNKNQLFMSGGGDFKIYNGDKELDKEIKKKTFAIEIDDTLYTNCIGLKFKKRPIYNPQNQKSRFQKRKIKKNGKRFVDSLYSLIDLKTI